MGLQKFSKNKSNIFQYINVILISAYVVQFWLRSFDFSARFLLRICSNMFQKEITIIRFVFI